MIAAATIPQVKRIWRQVKREDRLGELGPRLLHDADDEHGAPEDGRDGGQREGAVAPGRHPEATDAPEAEEREDERDGPTDHHHQFGDRDVLPHTLGNGSPGVPDHRGTPGTIGPMGLAVLASGSGTLLEAILAAGLRPLVVVSDRPCRALDVATAAGVPARLVRPTASSVPASTGRPTPTRWCGPSRTPAPAWSPWPGS